MTSTSVSSRNTHHNRKLTAARLTGRTFHQGRWCWLPMARSTRQVRWLPGLVENLMGSSFTSSVVSGGAAVFSGLRVGVRAVVSRLRGARQAVRL